MLLDLPMRHKLGNMRRKFRAGPLYVAGAFRSASGMGQGARLYAREMAMAGVPFYRLDLTREMRMAPDLESHERLLEPDQLAGHVGGTLILHANPPQFQLALLSLPKSFLETARIRPYWAWEWETLPPVWREALKYVDQLETPSHFCRRTFEAYTDLPVLVHPHAVPAPRLRKREFCRDGIVRCLCVFDAGSSLERKNPWAVLEVYRRAFTPGTAELTFKVTHSWTDATAFGRFRKLCEQTPGVRVMEGISADEDLGKLYLEHDVYISLHRSEGFGLTIREAMLHGLHVLATGWSGNMDYMRGSLCHPVPYELRNIYPKSGPMAGIRCRWAEADVKIGAEILASLGKSLSQGIAEAVKKGAGF